MSKSLILSERQKPRAIQLMKDIYTSHIADPTCGLGVNCPMMIDLKQRIESEERSQGDSNFSPSFGLK